MQLEQRVTPVSGGRLIAQRAQLCVTQGSSVRQAGHSARPGGAGARHSRQLEGKSLD